MASRMPASTSIAVVCLLGFVVWFLLRDGGPRLRGSPAGAPSATSPTREAMVAGVAEASPAASTSTEVSSPDGPTVRGLVLDAEGRPVSGAEVRVQDASATSGDDGGFVLRLPPFSATGSAGTLTATKEGHGVAQVEVRKSSPPVLRVVLPPAAAILGEVVSPTGPVGGARVRLVDGAWRRLLVTSQDGRFRFPEARTGRSEIAVMADGFLPATVQVAPGIAERRVRIWLDPTEDLPVRVVDEAGDPVEGAEVTVNWNWSDLRAFGTSDRNGLAMRLPRSNCQGVLHAAAPGYAPGGCTLSSSEGQDEIRVVLSKEVVLEVRLVGTAPEERGSWSVALGSNRWQDPNAPPTPPGPLSEWSTPPIGQVHGDRWVGFDQGGKASLHGVKAGGAYTIVAARRGADGTEESFRTVVWRTGSLPDGTREIEWTPPRLTPVRITTRESGTGGGVTAKVLIRPDPATLAAHETELPGPGLRLPEGIRTGPDGQGTARLWPGSYTFTAYGGFGTSGDAFVSADVTVGSDEGKVDLLLPAVHVVRGTLRTAAGIPLPGRSVSLWGRDQQPVHYFVDRADDSGAFAIHGVPEGTYALQWDGARGEGLFHGPRQVSVPTDTLELVVSLCSVHGDVRPVPKGPSVVALRPPRTGEWVTEPLDDTGAFEVSGLSPGEWLLEVRTPRGVVLGRSTVTVADGAVLAVTLK